MFRTTQAGGLVELDGSGAEERDIAGNPVVGLDIVGENITVRGLMIKGFPPHGIQIRPTGAPGGNNIIRGNIVGGDGVRIFEMPTNIVAGNVIRDNKGRGVSIEGPHAVGNRVLHNKKQKPPTSHFAPHNQRRSTINVPQFISRRSATVCPCYPSGLQLG